MDKLKMHTVDLAEENYRKLAALFPDAVTETVDKDGRVVRAIDKDVLMQEINTTVVDDGQQRYRFTWPDKNKAILLANEPTTKTLRLEREKSVGRDGTNGGVDSENIYIEGDNLDALKILRETYLGKVKMIYIDPPYNTGNDFIYEDDFSQKTADYVEHSGQTDEEGNRLVQNTESNGRFHTDWLNMIYPRLKIAKDLIREDGAIFIHIDEHEESSLQSICREIFGEVNELGTIIWDKRNPKGAVSGIAYQHESIVAYCKNRESFSKVPFSKEKEHASAMMDKVRNLVKKEGAVTEHVRKLFKEYIKINKDVLTGGEAAYNLIDNEGNIYQAVSMAAPDKPETRSHRPLIHPLTGKACPVPSKGWRYTDETMDCLLALNKIEFGKDETTQPRQKYYLKDNMTESVSSLLYYGGNGDSLGLPFDNPKPVAVVQKVISTLSKGKRDIILDFFSGSATTAHSVMNLNVRDGGNRKFIMVQLPEPTSNKSEAYKSGYKTICDIGEERIRRAGKKIKEETGADIDYGFRCFKVDSGNMEDVYYSPNDLKQEEVSLFSENVKPDRTEEDLLFQVMLDLGILLSSKIEEKVIAGKKVFSVADGYLMACFDKDVTEETVMAIAKEHPFYAVFRDGGMNSDSVIANFEQIFETYSPETQRRIL